MISCSCQGVTKCLESRKEQSQTEQDDIGIDTQDADRTCCRLLVPGKDNYVCFARYLSGQNDGH